MLPSLFLNTFWQMDLRPQVFVAMSFDEAYRRRFSEVIEPAVEGVHVDGVPLKPYRVDLSKSGDSILTDIIDGIAHCQLFLADVSVIGIDSRTRRPYRNGNVMYEVGLALACRQSAEILLVRDDRERFLFDVSTIPHLTIDFTDPASAQRELRDRMLERLRERQLVNDARVAKAIASLTSEEVQVIKMAAHFGPTRHWSFQNDGFSWVAMAGLPRLCDKQLVRLAGQWTTGGSAFQWTPLGHVVAQVVLRGLSAITPEPPETEVRFAP